MNKSFKLFVILMFASLGLAVNNAHVSARGFSGGHSFHSSHIATHPTYHATRTYQSPRSYTSPRSNNTTKSNTMYGRHRLNRSNNSNNSNNYNNQRQYNQGSYQNRKSGFLQSDFGRSLTRGVGYGAGWSIGSHMGNSLWHTMFGWGDNSYVGQNGQIMQQQPGYSGLFILAILIVIIVVIVLAMKKYRSNRYY